MLLKQDKMYVSVFLTYKKLTGHGYFYELNKSSKLQEWMFSNINIVYISEVVNFLF